MPDKRVEDDRVSLGGIDPEAALRALLAVDPEAEPNEDASAKERPIGPNRPDTPRKPGNGS